MELPLEEIVLQPELEQPGDNEAEEDAFAAVARMLSII
jgi:hypothetical protein